MVSVLNREDGTLRVNSKALRAGPLIIIVGPDYGSTVDICI